MEPYQKSFIDLALKTNALGFGEFTLKSGRKSPYFFNVGQLSNGLILKKLGECYAHCIQHFGVVFDVIFGPAYKGIPLACATSIALYSQHQRNIPYCFDRKEEKDHGEGGRIIGATLKGEVLIIDDVITAGTAIRASYELIRANQAKVAGIVVALDRQEKGQNEQSAIQEIEGMLNTKVYPIITFAHIMEYVEHHPEFFNYRRSLLDYRQKYGAKL